MSQKINGKPFTVVGDGKQKRDFTYVTDVVSAFYKSAISKVENEILNVGSGKCVSVNRIIKILKGLIVNYEKSRFYWNRINGFSNGKKFT